MAPGRRLFSPRAAWAGRRWPSTWPSRRTELGQRVVLVDGSLQFGDVGVLLNLNPKNKSIADLARSSRAATGVDDPR
jgi:hypothetical protein